MNISHQAQVLAYLKNGKTITQAEAITYFNRYRLSAVINCLRNAGYEIVTHIERNRSSNGNHARYELKTF